MLYLACLFLAGIALGTSASALGLVLVALTFVTLSIIYCSIGRSLTGMDLINLLGSLTLIEIGYLTGTAALVWAEMNAGKLHVLRAKKAQAVRKTVNCPPNDT